MEEKNKTTYERVFSYSWFGGPMLGVANLYGQPHYFIYCDNDEHPNGYFCLSPISREMLALVVEDWQLQRRWQVAVLQGRIIEEDDFPYLFEDRVRGEVISARLEPVLQLDESNCVEYFGDFQFVEGQEYVPEWRDMVVKWEKK